MVNRDRRYDIIGTLFKDSKIRTFNDIFEFVPKTVVANSMGKKVDRFTEMMMKVEKFKLEELFTIAKLCELDEHTILDLALKEYLKQKKSKK